MTADEIKGQIRQKQVKYKDLQNEYKVLMENYRENAKQKKIFRKEISDLVKEKQKQEKIENKNKK